METPKEIFIFEEDFNRKDHLVRYGINQDGGIRGLISFVRSDVVTEMKDEAEDRIINAAIEWIRRNANIHDFRWASVFREAMNKVK